MSAYSITTVSDEKQLLEILALQKINLPVNISKEERAEQGFVTCDHSFELLEKMNTPFPHVISLFNNKVVGYTLVMLPLWRNELEVLLSMFAQIDQLKYKNRQLRDVNYFTMGQVCIAKEHRSKGLFQLMFQKLKQEMSVEFECCITEIATDNTRSLKAHANVGFEKLYSYIDERSGISWELVIWNWV